MDALSRTVRIPPRAPGATLGAARDNATGGDKAPPVVLRVDNVVPFVAERSDGSAARRPLSAQDAAWPGGGQAAAMAAAREALPRRSTRQLRWAACWALALACHAAVAAALLLYWHPAEEQIAGAPLILIELAPLPVAPAMTPSDAPPGPQQTQTAAAPPVEPTVARDTKPEPNKRSRSRRSQTARQLRPCHPRRKPSSRLRRCRRPSRPNSREKRSTRKVLRVRPARPAAPRIGRTARRRRRRALPRVIPPRCRTGNRGWSPGSSATSATQPRRRRAASTA